MRTSDIRKNALQLAHEFYEHCAGGLRFSIFDIDEGSKNLGFSGEGDAQAIFSYLTSTDIMASAAIGPGLLVRFTNYGISVIEASIDRPNDPSGPFPPLSVVVGDIGAGAQVAIGAGHFHQERNDTQGPQVLRELLPLLQAASAEMRTSGREEETTLLATAQNEARSDECDTGYLKATLIRFAKAAGNVITDSASQALLAYCKAQGLLP